MKVLPQFFDPFSPQKLHVRYLTRRYYPELYRSLYNSWLICIYMNTNMYIYIYTYIYVYTYIYIQLFYCYSIPNAFFSKLSLYNNTVHTVDNMPTVVCFLAQYIVIICNYVEIYSLPWATIYICIYIYMYNCI